MRAVLFAHETDFTSQRRSLFQVQHLEKLFTQKHRARQVYLIDFTKLY